MIVLNVTFKSKDNLALLYVKELESNGMAEYVRHEKGNHKYDYYLPLKENGGVLLVEKWDSLEDLNAHLSSDNIKKMQEIKKKYNIETNLEKYFVE